jgi:hypothetical protein
MLAGGAYYASQHFGRQAHSWELFQLYWAIRREGPLLLVTRCALRCAPLDKRYPPLCAVAWGYGAAVRAENPVHGSDQQVCSPGARPVMIIDHVHAVRVPPDHATSRVAAAVPPGGDVEDRRDLDPAPPARRLAAAADAPPETELGGPGPSRGPAQRDTERPPPRGCGCWSPRTRSCAGTATSSAAAGPPGPCAAGPAGRRPAGTSGR